ncbi:STAS domain-containing protein [Mycobacterium kyogaense]|uniref:STAS domain-containing protein n=1 Tax=Mycobacterium kyogaense TaxID=2212479 RepID=UPI000DAED0D6
MGDVGRQNGHSFTLRRLPDSTSILFVSGDIDDAETAAMGRVVADELTRQPAQLVLELSRATSVGGQFVTTLVDASSIAGKADTSFCLVVSPTGPVADALAAADLLERFEIFTSLHKAQLKADRRETLGAAVIEQSQRARGRAQKTVDAARKASEQSRRLRRFGPHTTDDLHPGGTDPQV